MSLENKLRAILRDAFKHGNLEARRTYYDYYDSCHAPEETPNAPWRPATEILSNDRFKKGGGYLKSLGNGVFELYTGYSRHELRLRGSK